MLDDLELPLVQSLRTEEDQVWVEHGVPALEGALLQRLARAPTRIDVRGVIAGDQVLETLERLRNLYKDAAPVSFVADILTATQITQVLVADLNVREVAGMPGRYTYGLSLVEYTDTPDPSSEEPPEPEPPEPEPPCEGQTGSIAVTVMLPEGQTDYSGIVVRVQRVDVEGEPPFEITEQTSGVYTRTGLPRGDYRATALRR
jgi:hypothetical protein